jgi:hypothetical protein
MVAPHRRPPHRRCHDVGALEQARESLSADEGIIPASTTPVRPVVTPTMMQYGHLMGSSARVDARWTS